MGSERAPRTGSARERPTPQADDVVGQVLVSAANSARRAHPSIERYQRTEPADGDVPSLLVRERRSVVVRDVLSSLPSEQRDVVVSVYFGGHSQSEVAVELGLSPQIVRRSLFLGLRQLGNVINERLAAI
jgi:DNA-directed RNA polymerase specialized sigma24 family protein